MRLFINSVFDGIRCCWELLRIHGEARKAKPLPSQVPRIRVRGRANTEHEVTGIFLSFGDDKKA
jgi:hypothetical protein